LSIAKKNAVRHGVSERIVFVHADLFKPVGLLPEHIVKEIAGQVDIIVSNPPYIASTDLEALSSEVKQEPLVALNGGKGGVEYYRRIITESPYYLRGDGLVVMEMGYNQIQALQNIVDASDVLKIQEIINDYAGFERVVILQKKER
jgi:release factor glutamine methyltransferase